VITEKYISEEECMEGKVYSLHSRNLNIGVYAGEGIFIGIREKFGERYLDKELHIDRGGTARGIRQIGEIRKEIELKIVLGIYDEITGKEVRFDRPIADGGRGWYYVDSGEGCTDIRAVSKANEELFKNLEEIRISERMCELEEELKHLGGERLRLIKKLEKIENLSKYGWEQVEKNPEEAKELFKMIHSISR